MYPVLSATILDVAVFDVGKFKRFIFSVMQVGFDKNNNQLNDK